MTHLCREMPSAKKRSGSTTRDGREMERGEAEDEGEQEGELAGSPALEGPGTSVGPDQNMCTRKRYQRQTGPQCGAQSMTSPAMALNV